MRIVVPIKQVPETKSVKMDEETGTVIREGVEAIVNPLDLYAIETAIQLREQLGGEVISISMGPPKAITALREAIAMGIDSAVLVSDSAFAGSDTWATSYILAEAIKRTGEFSLVICGERATDGDTGQVGPGIAAFLDLPVVTYVSRIEQITDQNCRVNRLVEDGYEDLSSSLPCVITVVKEISVPRLPTFRGKQRAKKIEIPVWGSDNLDVELSEVGVEGSPTRVIKIFKPKVARECEKVLAKDEESVEEAVDKLTGFLRHKELI
ncbi:Caffeyl-CoA reductase-Etf complex subunit CarD [subsurface metagenome]